MSVINKVLKKLIIGVFGTKWIYRLLSFFLPFRCRMTAEHAREELQAYSPMPACKTALTQVPNQLLPPQVDLQIIIPCYNCEQYLEACMNSVLSQKTIYSYHVFLIDDGSKDGTAALLDGKYAGIDKVTVIHKGNGGASSARNAGLKTLIGKYVMFVDADDTLLQGAIQSLMECALSYNADVVQGGFETVFSNGTRIKSSSYDGKIESTDIPGVPWGKVYRASLWTNLIYPIGYWFEDTMNHFLLHRPGLSCYAVPQSVYAYLQHSTSSTAVAVHNKRSVETYWITEMLLWDMKIMDMSFDAACLEKVLWQFVTNMNRCLRLPSAVRRSIFILQCDLLDQYFPNCDSYVNSESGVFLKKRYYCKYLLFCLHKKCIEYME